MGCYDTVIVACPKCGASEDFQSKSGPCAMQRHHLEFAPDDIMRDVNRHSPHECDVCGTLFYVDDKTRVATPLPNLWAEWSAVTVPVGDT